MGATSSGVAPCKASWSSLTGSAVKMTGGMKWWMNCAAGSFPTPTGATYTATKWKDASFLQKNERRGGESSQARATKDYKWSASGMLWSLSPTMTRVTKSTRIAQDATVKQLRHHCAGRWPSTVLLRQLCKQKRATRKPRSGARKCAQARQCSHWGVPAVEICLASGQYTHTLVPHGVKF